MIWTEQRYPYIAARRVSENWLEIRDGNYTAFALFKNHYTYKGTDLKCSAKTMRFVGPGERIVLISRDLRALFVWRKERYRLDGETGVNCAVFRNEGDLLSSMLILEAEEWARDRWPGERLFTFVNPRKINSPNPGYCFKKAGWKPCGATKKRNILILEKL